MDIWIEDKVGFINGYSLMNQPDLIKIEVIEEPIDFMNWHWDGNELVHDPESAPKPEPIELNTLDEVIKRQDMADSAVLELADMILMFARGGV